MLLFLQKNNQFHNTESLKPVYRFIPYFTVLVFYLCRRSDWPLLLSVRATPDRIRHASSSTYIAPLSRNSSINQWITSYFNKNMPQPKLSLLSISTYAFFYYNLSPNREGCMKDDQPLCLLVSSSLRVINEKSSRELEQDERIGAVFIVFHRCNGTPKILLTECKMISRGWNSLLATAAKISPATEILGIEGSLPYSL